MQYVEIGIFLQKKCKNICVYEKKVVILHDFSCIVEWTIVWIYA